MSRGGKRPRYRETSFDQRKLLMDEYDRTKNVTAACRRAKVGRNTFYLWRPRYELYGYECLKLNFRRANRRPRKITSEVENTIISLKKEHPDWGKLRIANELKKQNNGENVVCAKTVKKVLMKNRMWINKEAKRKEQLKEETERKEPQIKWKVQCTELQKQRPLIAGQVRQEDEIWKRIVERRNR